MSALDVILRDEITIHGGAISLGRYMDLCLGHPQYGYYMTRDPFGAAGDFITAPEISQMFGEMIGFWLADVWMKMGRPDPFVLLECGPGRGTLMADILRTTKGLTGFHDAMHVYLMEMSPVLRDAQMRALSGYSPHWITDINDLPADMPILMVGNEFLDALPIEQYVHKDGVWFQRFVELDQDGSFQMVEKKVVDVEKIGLPTTLVKLGMDGVIEHSPILNQFLKSLFDRALKQGGTSLFIDYGYVVSGMGETLQAVRSHRFVSLFDTPGHCDLTAHVNFENLSLKAWEQGLIVHGATTQGGFLKGLGIDVRAERLGASANERQKQDLQAALKRLIDTDQMGSLFKVMAVTHDPDLRVEGFDESL